MYPLARLIEGLVSPTSVATNFAYCNGHIFTCSADVAVPTSFRNHVCQGTKLASEDDSSFTFDYIALFSDAIIIKTASDYPFVHISHQQSRSTEV